MNTETNTPLPSAQENPFQKAPSGSDHDKARYALRDHLKEVACGIISLLKKIGDSSMLQEGDRIQKLFESSSFTVTVTGSFSRGKSTLLNHLLETDLPTGDLPTTAMLTRIRYGIERMLWHCPKNADTNADANAESVSLQWSAIPDHASMTESEATSGHLLYQIPLQWLQQRQLEFVDTPGIDDTELYREKIASEMVRSSDAVLITIGATMPLSLSERTYIEEHIYAKKIPKIAVVITMIDRIPVEERAAVVENIRYRVQSWQPSIQIWLANDIDTISSEEVKIPVGIDAIRANIDQWASNPEHHQARTFQIKTQLEQLLELVAADTQARLACSFASRAEVDKVKHELKKKLDAESLQWNEIELEMDRRAHQAGKVLENNLIALGPQMITELQTAFNDAAHPASWLEKELPFQVTSKFNYFASLAGDSINDLIAKDFRWLNETAKKFYGQWVVVRADHSIQWETIPQGLDVVRDTSLSEAQRKQLMMRAGLAVAGTGSLLFFGPLGPVLAIATAFFSEKSYHAKTESLKETVRQEIAKFVPYLFENLMNEAFEKIRTIYRTAVINLRSQKKEWYRVQLDAITSQTEKGFNDEEAKELQQRLQEIDVVRYKLSQSNE